MNKYLPLSFFVLLASSALPGVAVAATLALTASPVALSLGSTVTVQVLVTSTDQAMNAVSGSLKFPSDLLEVTSVSKSGSIISLWPTEPSFSNASGIVSFEGVVLNPGFTGTSGKILTVTFRAKSEGTARLSFASPSVLANDGKGTEILTNSTGATVSLQAKTDVETHASAPAPGKQSLVVSGGPVVTSPTHPDQARWYANSSPEFTWNLPPGALEVRTIISENALATPNVKYAPPISTKTVQNLPDGTYYFFVQVRTKDGWGPSSRYEVHIDTTPPEKFRITFPHGDSGPNPQPIILFNTVDGQSGVDHYDVKVGSGGPLKRAAKADSNPYTLPTQEPGARRVSVVAFDRAGNTTESEADFTVEGIEPPNITDYQKELTVGDILRIRGTTYPNADIEIAISENDRLVVTERTRSNTIGDFAVVVSKRLWPGTYSFTARVTDDRGARSMETKPHEVKVRLHFFSDAVTFIVNYFFIALSLLIGITVVSAAGIWSWFKLRTLTRRMRRESDEVQVAVHESFGVIRKGVANHIRTLQKARRARTLTSEELEFLEQFEDILYEAEHSISRKIDHIPAPKQRRNKRPSQRGE